MGHTSLLGLDGYVLLNIAWDKAPLCRKMAKNGVKQPKKIGKTLSSPETATRLVSLTNFFFHLFPQLRCLAPNYAKQVMIFRGLES